MARLTASLLAATLTGMVSAGGCLAPPQPRSTARPSFLPAPNRQFRKDVSAWRQVQSRHVVLQQQEYTCGAASLATVLQFYWGDPATERKVLHAALHGLGPDEIADREENGLSMEDLARGSSRLGYSAAVLEMDFPRLRRLPAPVVVRLVEKDFKHFVVFRGELDGRVFVADPIRGNARMPVGRFLDQWDNHVLAVIKRGADPPPRHPLQIPGGLHATPERQAARRSLFTLPSLPIYRQ